MNAITIIGFNGGFGKLFFKHFAKENVTITGIDLQPKPAINIANSAYIQADILALESDLIANIKKANCIIFCVPEAALLQAYSNILTHLTPGTLVVDTLSVKTTISAMAEGQQDLEVLSLNPLFAPDLGFLGNNIAAVSFHGGSHTATFVAFLKKWGSVVSFLTAEQHDKLTAVIQVATHFSLLCFGSCLAQLDYKPDSALFTPVHEVLLSLFGRMVSQNPEVYYKIQTDNPYGQQTREQFIASANNWNKAINSSYAESFKTEFLEANSVVAQVLETLTDNFINYQTK